MFKTSILVVVGGLAVLASTGLSVPDCSRPLAAPTYYIAAKASFDSGSQKIGIAGTTNLPVGALLMVNIADYIGEGSHTFNDPATAAVGKDGFFFMSVSPKKGMSFHRNLICDIGFMANYPQQPATVIREVGRKGERLGFAKNPQSGVLSGENHYLSTVTVVE